MSSLLLLLLSLLYLLASHASWSIMASIIDKLVWAMCTATLCHYNALARWAKNMLSLYCFCYAVIQVTPCILVCVVPLGWSGWPVCFPGIIISSPSLGGCATTHLVRASLVTVLRDCGLKWAHVWLVLVQVLNLCEKREMIHKMRGVDEAWILDKVETGALNAITV
jgi:hypothetical protein